MLKLNTVLTFVCAIFLALISWLGKCIWDDVAISKAATISTAVQMQSIHAQVDDHETRIRQTEHDVIVLQADGHEPRSARSPKMFDNKP